MPRSLSTRSSNPAFGSRNPKAPSSPRSKAERSSTRNALKETSSFSEPADQHPFLPGTVVSVKNILFLPSVKRSRHKFCHRMQEQPQKARRIPQPTLHSFPIALLHY